ncbi:MAG: hypothetical protein M5U26_25600 [Planctomycetota bacterium]|nr:hypothetical protein [Planctomycetota bacterium]
MLIDRSHRGWITFTVLVFVLSGAYYSYYAHASSMSGGNGPSGGTVTGLAYGIVAFTMMVFCGLLGVRKHFRIWRLGRVQGWLRAHVWLGLLAYPLILFHAGMRFGNGLSFWLMVLFSIVIVSGLFGIIMQNLVPRTMLDRLPAESTYEQIPDVIESLRREADRLVGGVCGPLGVETEGEEEDRLPGGAASRMRTEGAVKGRVGHARGPSQGVQEGSGPLKAFYLEVVRPFLGQTFMAQAKLAVPQSSIAVFEHTRTLLPDTLHESLRDLESICDERRQLALQMRLHFWLHCWLFLHAPLSYALLVLSVFHAIKATFYF